VMECLGLRAVSDISALRGIDHYQRGEVQYQPVSPKRDVNLGLNDETTAIFYPPPTTHHPPSVSTYRSHSPLQVVSLFDRFLYRFVNSSLQRRVCPPPPPLSETTTVSCLAWHREVANHVASGQFTLSTCRLLTSNLVPSKRPPTSQMTIRLCGN
jgi:hypothetical protein